MVRAILLGWPGLIRLLTNSLAASQLAFSTPPPKQKHSRAKSRQLHRLECTEMLLPPEAFNSQKSNSCTPCVHTFIFSWGHYEKQWVLFWVSVLTEQRRKNLRKVGSKLDCEQSLFCFKIPGGRTEALLAAS